MSRLIDLTGEKFEKLTVIERGVVNSWYKGKDGPTGLCQCSCGKLTTVPQNCKENC